jgi:hypothetical protein
VQGARRTTDLEGGGDKTFVPRVEEVIAQTRTRVFGCDTRYPEKLLSLFEPATEAIRKGKAAKPTEFGHLVKIQEAERGLIVNYEVYEHRPAGTTLLLQRLTATRDSSVERRGCWRRMRASGPRRIGSRQKPSG